MCGFYYVTFKSVMSKMQPLYLCIVACNKTER